MNEQTSIIARQALADFLKQSVNEILCTPLIGGSDEDSIIKCTYNSNGYVVKFFSAKEFGKNEIAWTRHASDLGIGPTLYYADLAGSYMIIEFCEGDSLTPATANASGIIKNIAAKLALLHHSSAPFAHESDVFTRIDAKYKKLTCSGELKEILEHGMQYVKKIADKLQNFSVSAVPCHNDLNWGNIFTHKHQVTFIDWGDAALGDPYYDIAAFFVLNVIKPENEKLFFEQYDEKLLNSQWQAYTQCYKKLVRFEFALNLLLGVQAGKSELLYAQNITQVNNIEYYLTLLAQREVKIDSDFLYGAAIASLNEMAFQYID